MSDPVAPPPADAPAPLDTDRMRTVTLDAPIRRGDQVITSVVVRKPDPGELRGCSIVALSQLEYDALRRILPRVTIPNLLAVEVDAMDLGDLTEMGAILGDFLLKRAAPAAGSPPRLTH